MNFLQLCQMTARESSVISGVNPTSVVGQAGKLLKIVSFVADAWNEIQLMRPDWFWMEGEFTSNPTASGGTGKYTSNSVGITSRFSDWVRDRRLPNGDIYRPLTLYDPTIGLADEGPLIEISWESYRAKYGRGLQTENKPTEWAVSPAGELCLGSIPDGAYILRGPYRKSPQALAANIDIPECPTQFHPIIGWKGLMNMIRHDEAPAQIMDGANERFNQYLEPMERHQLEEMTLAGDPVA